jgi:hypothetical protein
MVTFGQNCFALKSYGNDGLAQMEYSRSYRYSAYVTHLKPSAELGWELLYRKRGDTENRIAAYSIFTGPTA